MTFVRNAKTAPYIITPQGKRVQLSVDNYAPYLIDNETEQIVLPAVEAEQRAEEAPTFDTSPLLLLWEQRRQPVA